MARKIELAISLIEVPIYRGVDLIKAREEAGLTQWQMAGLCNWSQGTQCKMEKLVKHQIDEATIRIINNALNS